jgi:hypothetical protein
MAPEVSERVCDGMAVPVVAAEVGEVSGAQFLSLVTEEGVKTAVAARQRQRLRITAPVPGPPPRGSRSDSDATSSTVSAAGAGAAVGPPAAVSGVNHIACSAAMECALTCYLVDPACWGRTSNCS